MTRLALSAACVFGLIAVATAGSSDCASEESTKTRVQIDGMKASYGSCSLVEFSVHNVSQEDVFVEVYVERFAPPSWKDETYSYAINDPESLYRKTVRADRLKPGASIPLSYDRCRKPRFVEGDEKSFRARIQAKDEQMEAAGTQALQRIRVEVRLRDPKAKVIKVWSHQFKRVGLIR